MVVWRTMDPRALGSAAIAKLWNVNFDLKGLRRAVLWDFWLNVYEMWGPKLQNVSYEQFFYENKIRKFFCVWFVDFFPPITGEPLTKRRCLHQISHCAACGITVKRSDLPGDYLKTNQNGLLPGRKWNVRFLLQSVWNANRFDRKHLHARENSQCEWH